MEAKASRANQRRYFILLGRIVSVKNNIQSLSTYSLPYEVITTLRHAASHLREAEDTLRGAYHTKAWPR